MLFGVFRRRCRPVASSEPRARKPFQARLIESFDKNIDKFELYVVRNCMRVPAHIDEASAAVIACAGSASAQDGTGTMIHSFPVESPKFPPRADPCLQ